VCCDSECNDPMTCSYTSKGCSGAYGGKHDCSWDSSNAACIVGL
jgi:hypothetical protein